MYMNRKHFFALSFAVFAALFHACTGDGTDTIVLPSQERGGGIFRNADIVFVNASIPIGATAIINSVQFVSNSTDKSSGTLLVTSSQELSELYLKIDGKSGYYVLLLSSGDISYSGSGSYVYSIDLDFSSGLSAGQQQFTVSGKTTEQTISSSVRTSNGSGTCPATAPSSSSGVAKVTSNSGAGKFTDERDGREYEWVKIGEQTWMAENLKFNASGSRNNTYGRSYNWTTAMNGEASSNANPSGVQGVCPDGWHLPSYAEWNVLITSVGGFEAANFKLRANSTAWDRYGNGDYIGTDDYGFAALPNATGSAGPSEMWWTATGYDPYYPGNSYYLTMHYLSSFTSISSSFKVDYGTKDSYGSIRCVKNDGNGGSSSPVSGNTGGRGNDISKYKTAKIGTQTWMAENLDYAVEGSMCYDDNPANCAKYGRLYNWAAAMGLDPSCNFNACENQVQPKHKGICPEGWHIPSSEEWKILAKYTEPVDNMSVSNSGYFSSTAGHTLKSVCGWNNYYDENGNGTDEYGFSALPGGYGNFHGISHDIGGMGQWWSMEEYETSIGVNAAKDLRINSDWGMHGGLGDFKSFYNSVRCVKNN